MKKLNLFFIGVLLCCVSSFLFAQEVEVKKIKIKEIQKPKKTEVIILPEAINTIAEIAPKALPEPEVKPESEPNTLVVLWSSDNKEVFTKMIYIYTLNAKRSKWWENVTFIIWGPSAVLLAEDEEVQKSLEKLHEAGVDLEACLWCTDQYNVTEAIKNMQVDVKYMGTQLTKYMKSNEHKVITF